MENIYLQEDQRNLFIMLAEAFQKRKESFNIIDVQQGDGLLIKHKALRSDTRINQYDLDIFRSSGLITSSYKRFNITMLGIRYYEHIKQLIEKGKPIMTADEITNNILSAMSRLSNDDIYTNIDSNVISREVNIPEKDLEIYMKALAKKGLVGIIEMHGGFDAHLTYEGILSLRNLNFNSSQNSASHVSISGVSNSIITIASSLTNSTSQIIDLASKIDDESKNELKDLMKQLSKALEEADPEKINPDDIESISDSAKDLVEALSKEKPNKARVEITKEGLEKAASNIGSTLPQIILIVAKITEFVQKLSYDEKVAIQ
ncbi:MAG: hypothetical protein OHK0022_12910 [Roseiflexaceae bacterium]